MTRLKMPAPLGFTNAARNRRYRLRTGRLAEAGRPDDIRPSPRAFASDGDPSGALAGETVVFTGKLEIPRGVAAKAAAGMGCNVADSINKRTTILVVGDRDLRRTKGNEKSSKHRKAEEMIASGVPIRIVGESDFMLMVGQAAIEKATPTYPETVSPTSDTGKTGELVITLAPEASRINDLVERIEMLKRSGGYSAALDLLQAEIEFAGAGKR